MTRTRGWLAISLALLVATGAAAANLGGQVVLHRLPEPRPAAVLEGVSCASPTFCMAAGGYGTRNSMAFILRWNGRSWRVVATTRSNGFGLNSVACVSASFCLAVGQDERNRTLAERWNGRSWSRIGAPPVSGSEADALNAVSCQSASDCWGAGTLNGFSRPARSVVEHYGPGGWRLASAPELPTALTSISCASAQFCVATAMGGRALRYDGHSWRAFQLPGVFDTNNRVWVGCRAITACWIVGTHDHTGQPIAARLVGGSWMVVHMPMGAPRSSSTPQSVDCSPTGLCLVVGANQFLHRTGSTITTTTSAFAEQWNGTAWVVVPSSGGAGAFLQGVSCPPIGRCKTVGGTGHRAVVGTADLAGR